MTENEKEKQREALRVAYNKYAQERDSSKLQDWKIEERSKFLAHLQQEGRISLLEIGAGTGKDGKFFQEQGLKVTCIDLSPAMIELCKQKGLDAYVMDVTELDFPADSFDAIYAMNSLLHLTKMEFSDALLHLNQLLKPDGLFYLGIYGGVDQEGIWEKDAYEPKRFFSFFTDEHLKQTVEKDFEILYFRTIHFETEGSRDFQSLVLRKRGLESGDR